MADRLNVPLLVARLPNARIPRYLFGLLWTVKTLLVERPDVVIVPSPSAFLGAALMVLRTPFRFRLVIDAHWGGIVAFNGSKVLQGLLNWCNSGADLTIVTNDAHAERVRKLGGRAEICEDPLPELEKFITGTPSIDRRKVIFVCSFDADEPYREAFKAVSALVDSGIRMVVTGNYRRAAIDPKNYPEVTFLGFVPRETFYWEMATSSVVLDLTTNEDCLVCGAYEAISLGRPVVLSRTRAQQAYFSSAATFVEPEASSIAAGIVAALSELKAREIAVSQWRCAAQPKNHARLIELSAHLKALGS